MGRDLFEQPIVRFRAEPEKPAGMKPSRRWGDKFIVAFRGVWLGACGQSSFFVHFFFSALAIAALVVLDCNQMEWCLIIGCIGLVMTTELLNSAIETLFRGLEPEARDRVYTCLDMAAGAVLLASMTAVAIGGIIFGRRLLMCLGIALG